MSSLFGQAANTNTQSTPSLFGSSTTTQPQQSNSVFGNFGKPAQSTSPFGTLGGATQTQSTSPFGALGAATETQQTPSLFGASAATQPAQSGNSLFGSSTTAQPQQSDSLFGGALGQNNTSAQAKPALSLFGNTSTNQPSSTPSLFGASPTTTQPPAQPSLFGASTTQPTTQPSLFGTSTTQPATTNSLFGNTNTNTSTAQPQQQPSTSLFGSTLQSPNARPGGLTLGQSNTNGPQLGNFSTSQSNTIPGVRIDVSNIRSTTRFNDLTEELQKVIENIDTFIQNQISQHDTCAALMPAHGETVDSIPADVDYVKQKIETAELALDNDSSAIEQMKGVVRKDVENAKLSFGVVENLKLPQQFHYTGMWHGGGTSRGGGATTNAADDVVGYFAAQAEEMSKTLEVYTKNIKDVENHLRTLEANAVQQSQQVLFKKGTDGRARSNDDQVREMGVVLNGFEGGIVNVAERVADLRQNLSAVVEAGKGGLAYKSENVRAIGWR